MPYSLAFITLPTQKSEAPYYYDHHLFSIWCLNESSSESNSTAARGTRIRWMGKQALSSVFLRMGSDGRLAGNPITAGTVAATVT